MEDTLENKSLVFRLYQGQRVVKHSSLKEDFTMKPEQLIPGHLDKGHYLSLKDITKISDNDLVVLYHSYTAATLGYVDLKDQLRKAKQWKKSDPMYIFKACKEENCYKYLISQGYFLGGILEIAYGWVRLEEK